MFFHQSEAPAGGAALGDALSFAVRSDARSGKPVAMALRRLEPGELAPEVRLPGERREAEGGCPAIAALKWLQPGIGVQRQLRGCQRGRVSPIDCAAANASDCLPRMFHNEGVRDIACLRKQGRQRSNVCVLCAERIQGRVLRPPGQARPQADAARSAGESAPSAERGAGDAAGTNAAEPEPGPGPGPGSAAGGLSAAAEERSAGSPAGGASDAPTNGVAHEAASPPAGVDNAVQPGSAGVPGGADEPAASAAEQAPAALEEAAPAPAPDAARSAAGTLAYLDAGGKERRASFLAEQAAQSGAGPGGDASQPLALGPGDDVEFTVVVDRRVGSVRAEDVRLVRCAQPPVCATLRPRSF